MKDDILIHNGEKLVPVQIDPHTWVLFPPDKATRKHVKAYKESIRRSKELALRGYGNKKHIYDE